MACLDEETIVAFVGMGGWGAGAEARLSSSAIHGVDAHVRGCAACRDLLSAALAAAPRTFDGCGGGCGGGAAVFDAASVALARGTSFGRYTVLDLIGRGAMGEVYAAYDPVLDRKVALKILNPDGRTADPRSRGRLLREAKAIAKLRDPNVVVIHEAGTVDDRVFLAMEYVEGETLEAWLAERPRTHREILAVFTAAARGLGAAHAAGIVHRDFKPQNVMVDLRGGVRVMDFGLAREIDGVEAPALWADDDLHPPARPDAEAGADPLRLTQTGELIGTPLYMAPEQFRTRRADARSDQFSLCVVLYRALYGVHPFAGRSLGELMASVIGGRVLPAPSGTSVPQTLRRVLLRGLAVDPEARWESMQALTAAFGRDPARKRRRWLAGGAIAAAVLGAVVAVRAPGPSERLCRGGPSLWMGVWEADERSALEGPHTRRAASRAAFLRTGVEEAARVWRAAARVLDRYVADWLDMYGDTCAATHLRGEQSAEVLDLRMACLRDRLDRVRALTDVFAGANSGVVANAVAAASALPTLERCADVAQLRAAVAPPETREARDRLAALRKELARVKALSDAGQCVAAADGRRKLIAAADSLGYGPMQADAHMVSMRSAGLCDDPVDTMEDFRRAAFVGLASGYDEVAAEAAILQANVEADRMVDSSRARDWIDVATAIMQRMGGGHPVLESWRLQTLATIHSKEGNVDLALATMSRALALTEKVRGREHWDYVMALSAAIQVFFDGRRYDEAIEVAGQATKIATSLGGPRTPLVALLRASAAELFIAERRYAEARAEAEQALAIWRNAGASPYYRVFALAMLGEALLGEGRAEEAAARLEEELPLVSATWCPYLHAARFALARAIWSAPGQRPRALILARQARADYERARGFASKVAEVDAWLEARL